MITVDYCALRYIAIDFCRFRCIPIFSQARTLDLLRTEFSKNARKQTVNNQINTYWVAKTKVEASEKSSLRFLNTQKYEIGEVHYVWKNAGFNLMTIKKAGLFFFLKRWSS